MKGDETSSKQARAVIFDLFSTLVFIHNKINPYNKLFRVMALSHDRSRQLKTEILTSAHWNAGDAGLDNGSIEAEFLRGVEREVASTMLYPETISVLSELRRRGYVLGCISNLAWPYKAVVDRLGLDRLIDSFVFSCDAGLRKPQPEIYALASERVGIPPGEMLVVGNNPVCDVAGPQASGLQALLLMRGRDNDGQGISSLSELLALLPAIK
jgi:FMN phosphatase YigB (HAD superfamily)